MNTEEIIKELSDLAHKIFEDLSSDILLHRQNIINYLIKLYCICCGDGANGLWLNVFKSNTKLLYNNEKTNLNDITNQMQLDTILAEVNTYFCNYDYEILNDVIIRFRNNIKINNNGNVMPKNSDEFCDTCIELYDLIKLMKLQYKRKRLFGRWFPQIRFKI